MSVCLCLLLFLSLTTRLTMIILGDGNMNDRVPLYFSIFSKAFFHNKHLCLLLTRRESSQNAIKELFVCRNISTEGALEIIHSDLLVYK